MAFLQADAYWNRGDLGRSWDAEGGATDEHERPYMAKEKAAEGSSDPDLAEYHVKIQISGIAVMGLCVNP